MDERPRLCVVGLGNRLQSDEALGSLVVERLPDRLQPELRRRVAVIDGGTIGLGLLPYLDDIDGLMVVDAIDRGAPPGSLIDIDAASLLAPPGPLGVHELGAVELLGALRIAGRLPARVRIVGLQPETIGLGTELSPTVAANVPQLLDHIAAQLETWAAA